MGREQEEQGQEVEALAVSEAEQSREIASGWQMSDRGREAVAAALALRKTKHALYAQAPQICRGALSPCSGTCALYQQGLAPEGERCPLEIVAITEYFNRYADQLEVDVENMVDLGLVRELAEVETQLDRIANRLAQEDLIQEVAVGVDRQGNEIRRPEVHKAFDIQERLRTRKDRILDQLNATRKARAKKDPDETVDPSVRAAMLIAKAEELRRLEEERGNPAIIDVTPEKIDRED